MRALVNAGPVGGDSLWRGHAQHNNALETGWSYVSPLCGAAAAAAVGQSATRPSLAIIGCVDVLVKPAGHASARLPGGREHTAARWWTARPPALPGTLATFVWVRAPDVEQAYRASLARLMASGRWPRLLGDGPWPLRWPRLLAAVRCALGVGSPPPRLSSWNVRPCEPGCTIGRCSGRATMGVHPPRYARGRPSSSARRV